VPGLRREELAQLAGVSVDYYTRLEQGRQPTASVSVLDALASALRLTDTERVYLHRLAWVPVAPRTGGRAVPGAVRPGTYRLMELLETAPAILCDRRTDILAFNDAARLVFADFTALPARQRNAVRWCLSEAAQRLFGDEWESIAGEMVGMLRLGASGHINDPRTVELIDELTANSPMFCRLWADRRVSAQLRDSKTLHHPTAGTLQLMVEVLAVPGAPEQTLHVTMPKQGSRSEAAIQELVSQSRIG
jgi:transcriptional regulator with XRE-family HTH domain